MTEIAKIDDAEVVTEKRAPIQHAGEANAIISMIERVAVNPDVDIEKMERLMEMRRQEEDRFAERAFNSALAAVQGQIGPVLVNKENIHTRSRYANLEAIANKVRPILTAHGFSTTFKEMPSSEPGFIHIKGVLKHADGWKEEYENRVPLDGAGAKGNTNKTATHAHGSSLTYARRYCLMGMLDISITEDDDGNAGGGAPETISAEQYIKLRDLIETTGGDEAKFCAFQKINSLHDLPAKHFDSAITLVNDAAAKRKEAQNG